MSNVKHLTYLGLFFSMIVWAISYVLVKITYDHGLSPATLVFSRLLISSIFFVIYGLISKKMEKIRKGDFKWFLTMSFFEPFLYYLCESNGLKFVSASVGAIVIATIPIFTPLMMNLFYKEKISKNVFGGVVLSFFGILLVIFNENNELSASSVGLLLMFLTVICALGYTLSLRNLVSKYNSLTVVAYQTYIGAVLYLPLWIATDFDTIGNVDYSWEMISSVFGLAIFASSLAYIFFSNGMRELGATKTTVFSNLIPVFTAIFAFSIGYEAMSIGKMIGVVFVVVGVFYVQSKKPIISDFIKSLVRKDKF